MNRRDDNSHFWERLKKRALTDALIDELRESRSLDPFLTAPRQHSMLKIDCAASHTKCALVNAVNTILGTKYHSVFYLHSDKAWKKFCKNKSRFSPFIRCGPIKEWQVCDRGKPPIILSRITREMTRDRQKQDTESRVIALCNKHVRNVFNDRIWPSINGSYNAYFSRLYPNSEKIVKDGRKKIGALVLRCMVFASIGEREVFYKYKPLLFALRYGIPIEPHPFQPRYLSFLTR